MSESQEWDDLEEFLAERLIPLPAPADARWSDCMARIEIYARQQVVVALEKLANHTAKGFTGCVVCKYVSEAGHREDCLLAAALRAGKGTP